MTTSENSVTVQGEGTHGQPCVLFLLDWKPVLWSTREEYFLLLSRSLREQGIVPILTVSEQQEPEAIRRLEQGGAVVRQIGYGHDRLGYWRYIRAIAARHDVLIAQVRFFDYFALIHWQCRLAGIRNIIFTEANSGEWNRSGWRAMAARMRTWVVCAPLKRVIAISGFIRRRLEATGISSDIIRTVYNGIDVHVYTPEAGLREELDQQFRCERGSLLICFASALLGWKRPSLALEACQRLRALGVPFTLLMAGNGPMRKELEEQARALGIDDSVRWLGHYPHLQRLLAGSDAFLHTAVGEAFGNVLAEAMAAGLPVVATRSGGTPEVVDDSCGMLVDPGEGEAERLAAALARLAQEEGLKRRLGEAGVRRAKQLFSLETAVRNTLEVYRELTGGRITISPR